ncbi:thioredoxin family protein [Clostridium guangxiense]|uniref:thioredoxin family protein n=1 Tax=Clostridium guangxiense TaxID=1662055 RepID=UPI001E4FE1ED|nr:thioredoxin family protein [Clostridium guangxiense]MCD2346136.1 thioredoxin family protein [Clostridium guangxiense]
MEIKILGTGCSKCKKLEANANEAIKDLKVEAKITKVEDIKEIMKYGVMRTPAIVVNEKVKMFGKVCTVDEIKKYISDEK